MQQRNHGTSTTLAAAMATQPLLPMWPTSEATRWLHVYEQRSIPS
jgi:hypothetical protein